MEKNSLQLNDLDAYRIAYHFSNYVWDLVINGGSFVRDTLGKPIYTSYKHNFI